MTQLLRMITVIIVVQKKAPGKSEVSLIAKTTVKIKITTSIIILHTIRVVRFPLEVKTSNNELMCFINYSDQKLFLICILFYF